MTIEKSEQDHVIYADDYLIITDHLRNRPNDHRVSIRSGNPPEEATPTIVDGARLQVALTEYIMREQS